MLESNSKKGDTKVLLLIAEELIGADLEDTFEILGYSVTEVLTSLGRPLDGDYELDAHVVVIDLELQGRLDPIQVGRRIRERWNRPIVYLTDNLDQAERVAQFGDGARNVMWPFVAQALDDAVQAALRAGQTTAETTHS